MPLASSTSLRTAWKGSPAVIRAMGEGRHFLLLSHVAPENEDREARLLTRHLEFFLVPDRVELPRGAIREEFHSYLEGSGGPAGEPLSLRYKAIVTDGLMVMEPGQLRGLEAFHIWSEGHLAEDYRWDPLDPAFLLICKVHRIEPEIEIPWREAYGASGPWVTLEEQKLPAATFEPVVEHKEYLKVVVDVKKLLAEAQKNPMARPEPPAKAAPPPKPAAGTPPKPPAADPAKPPPSS